MKLIIFYTLIISHTCAGNVQVSSVEKVNDAIEDDPMDGGYEVIKLRVRKAIDVNPTSSPERERHKKREIIPAEDSLRSPQFSEEVEEKLGSTGLGKNSINRRLRKRKGIQTSKDANETSQGIASKGSAIKAEMEKVASDIKLEESNLAAKENGKGSNETHVDGQSDSKAITTNATDEINNGNNDLQTKADAVLQSASSLVSSAEESIASELVELKEKLEKALQNFLGKASELKAKGPNKFTKVLTRVARVLSQKKARNAAKRNKRDDSLAPFQACIYIDIPGSTPDSEVETFIPEELRQKGCNSEQNQAEGSGNEEAQAQVETEKVGTNTAEGEDSDGEVVWVRIPPPKNTHSDEIREKVDELVERFHDAGKDVLFVPISKGHLDNEVARNGFLKTLQINPERLQKEDI